MVVGFFCTEVKAVTCFSNSIVTLTKVTGKAASVPAFLLVTVLP